MAATWIQGLYIAGVCMIVVLCCTNADSIHRRPAGSSTGVIHEVGDASESVPELPTDGAPDTPGMSREKPDDDKAETETDREESTDEKDKIQIPEREGTDVKRSKTDSDDGQEPDKIGADVTDDTPGDRKESIEDSGGSDEHDTISNDKGSEATDTSKTTEVRIKVNEDTALSETSGPELIDSEEIQNVEDYTATDTHTNSTEFEYESTEIEYDNTEIESDEIGEIDEMHDDTGEPDTSGADFIDRVMRKAMNFLEGMTTFGTSSLDEVKQKLVDAMGSRLEHVINRVLGTGQRAGAHASDAASGFNITGMPESDVMRMIRDIAQLPEALQEKLSELHGLARMTIDELREFPASALPSFISEMFGDFRNYTRQKTAAICERLADESCSPNVLRAAFHGGLDCTGALELMGKAKHLFSAAQSRLMLEYMRATSREPETWNSSFITTVVTQLGGALTENDILSMSKEAFRESLANISRIRLPDKSQRKAVIQKLVADYMTPTAWSETLLEDMGRMVEDMDLTQIVYLRGSKVTAAADALRRSNIVSGLTRTAIAKNVYNGLWSRIEDLDENGIAVSLPWLKCDKKFVIKLNLTNLLTALNSTGMADVEYTDSEAMQISDRLRNSTLFSVLENMTAELLDGIGPAMKGMPKSLFAALPVDVIRNSGVLKQTEMASTAKARQIIARLRFDNRSLEVDGSAFGTLFKGLDVDDIEKMHENELEANLPRIGRLKLDTALARAVIKRMRVYIQSRAREPCSNILQELGNLAPHIPAHTLRHLKLIPGGITTDEDCDIDKDDVKITKAQAFAILDNVKEEVGLPGDETRHFDAKLIRRLGKCNIGLTAMDIKKLPIDSELFTIFELLSKYEDDVDSSQTTAIVNKIREAFNIENRNVVTEATDVTVAQIGRFLQYLNDEYELPKFPKKLRPLIVKEMGRSKMNKISTGKRRRLLQFALRNTKNGQGELVDMTKSAHLNEAALVDLGYLKCGMDTGDIGKLSAGAIEQHIEDLQLCPFKAPESRALVKRSLAYNTNTVKLRERLAALGPMVQHLTANEIININEEELSTVAEYLVTRMDERNDELDARYHNGFIREWTIADKEHEDEQKKVLLTKLHESLQESSSDKGVVRCHNLLALRSGAARLGALPYSSIQPCLDEIGTLHTWTGDDARTMLTSMSRAKYGQELNDESLAQWDDELVREVGGFIKGLRPDEIEQLPLANTQVMATLGHHSGYSMDQLKAGFNRWKYLRDQTHSASLSADELASMGEFACGATADFIRSHLQPDVVFDSVNALGELSSYSPEQLAELVGKVTDQLGNDVASWSVSSIAEIKKILGGFTKQQIRRLTQDQISVISPDTVSTLPPEKVKDFSGEQLAGFTNNQVNAITTMQRSYMDDDQMAAIGDFGINGGETVQQIAIGNTVWLLIFAFLLPGTY